MNRFLRLGSILWIGDSYDRRGAGADAPTHSRRGALGWPCSPRPREARPAILGPPTPPRRSAGAGGPLHTSYSLERLIRNTTTEGACGRHPPPAFEVRPPSYGSPPRSADSGPAAGASHIGRGRAPRPRGPAVRRRDRGSPARHALPDPGAGIPGCARRSG